MIILPDLTFNVQTSSATSFRFFMTYSPDFPACPEVPDPYYGGSQGFENVLDMVENASQGLLAHIRKQF